MAIKPMKPLKPLKPLKAMKAIAAKVGGFDFASGPGYSACFVYRSSPMVCPLCGVSIPAHTPHRCSKKENR